jgi:hypothetical protein
MARIRRYLLASIPHINYPASHTVPYPTSPKPCRQHAFFDKPPIVRPSSLRPARRSLAYIGIPSHHDVLAAQIRWANAWFYTHYRRRRCRRLRPTLASIDRGEVPDVFLSSRTEISVQTDPMRNIDIELFCVGGQFE